MALSQRNIQVEDGLLLAGVSLHGPVDMTLTALNWDTEGNPLVLWMGLRTWLVFKTALLAAIGGFYILRMRPELGEGPNRRVTWAMTAFAGIGAAVMLLNLLALYYPPVTP